MSDAVEDCLMMLGDDTNLEWEQYIIKSDNEKSTNTRLDKDYWTTKDGVKIYPKNMTIGHIVNTLKMIERNSNNPTEYKIYNLLLQEFFRKRGE